MSDSFLSLIFFTAICFLNTALALVFRTDDPGLYCWFIASSVLIGFGLGIRVVIFLAESFSEGDADE